MLPTTRRLRDGLVSSLLMASGTWSFDFDGCTSVAVGKGATVDGFAVVSHANDCSDCDFRVAYVPARDHEKGAKRTIYDAVWSQYPRLVDTKRSKQYTAGADISSSKVLGHIPEVEHTFALWEASYGLMNEHGLGMGESTCPAFLVGNGTDSNGTALFTVGNLMSIALERCKTARCAIQTMGDLGAKYGFYGEDPGVAGGGEAVTVVDKSGEAWVFHIAGGVPAKERHAKWADQRGAVWVAQRVPDGHVAVIANAFIIRKVDVHDKENFMAHPGLLDLVKESGFWDGNSTFDWCKSLQPDLAGFSYFPGLAPIPMYSSLRIWGIFRQAAPSVDLPPSPDLSVFPFSVPVDKKVTLMEIMDWFRTHYEGTEFDMRLGSLAGPWQTPNRAEGGLGAMHVPGQFARSTSIPRTSYTVILQSGPETEAAAWFAPDASASSVFVPFFGAALAPGGDGKFDVDAYGTGSMKHFDFAGHDGSGVGPAWWAFDFVANWMDLSYHNMSETYVYPKVQKMQSHVIEEAKAAVKAAHHAKSERKVAEILAHAQTDLQKHVVKDWWQFAAMLIVRYNDQFFNFPEHAPQTVATVGYPDFWLEMIGYDQTFFRPSWTTRSTQLPAMLPAAFVEALNITQQVPAEDLLAVEARTAGSAQAGTVVTAAIACMLSAVVGHFVGYRRGLSTSSRTVGIQDDSHYMKISA